ncbi:hypothetical protein MSAR_46910 [Mycolicibacterium sarraceniae]|uniref:Uncharacterized protein n=1 Tax=Mycolicibacterium sarraceniae TaxID=1534348 RepID=A0A7I7SZZ7_9MYCO|nr:hypothetical protein MSAR_46910 [Mycolicibacterium sarraceniae]
MAKAAADPSYDDALRKSHHADDSPQTGSRFRGAVSPRSPRGEEAGKLWDISVTSAANPHFGS